MHKSMKVFFRAMILIVVSLTILEAGERRKESSKSGGKTISIIDMSGRSVELQIPAAKVCAIGPGALRLACYTEAAGKVVGIENMEKRWGTGRPYILAYPELLEMPVIGQGGPDSTPDPEALLSIGPDVIFAAYLVDASKANELQEKTGIPVVVLSYGELGTFDQQLLDSITLVGQLTGNEARSREVVNFIKGCQEDLNKRTSGIANNKKPTVYAGGISMKGTHGIESTQVDFQPFTAINARNVMDETGRKGSVMIDKEQLLQWNPDIIFIDESGWQMVQEDYAKNPGLYTSLKAVQNGEVYGYLPYNYYTTNVDTALADAYFMGKVIYPNSFKDVDPVGKAGEIYRFLLGKDTYERMSRDFGGFKKLKFSGL
jgi:iron complex transport system substrate-binding protein